MMKQPHRRRETAEAAGRSRGIGPAVNCQGGTERRDGRPVPDRAGPASGGPEPLAWLVRVARRRRSLPRGNPSTCPSRSVSCAWARRSSPATEWSSPTAAAPATAVTSRSSATTSPARSRRASRRRRQGHRLARTRVPSRASRCTACSWTAGIWEPYESSRVASPRHASPRSAGQGPRRGAGRRPRR